VCAHVKRADGFMHCTDYKYIIGVHTTCARIKIETERLLDCGVATDYTVVQWLCLPCVRCVGVKLE
jgi:hypothetical protein